MNLEPYLALIESNSRKKSVYEIKLTVEDLQQVNPKRLFHDSPAIRRSAVRDLVESGYSGTLRILVELLHAENDLSLKYEIRKGLNEIQATEEIWETEQCANTRKLKVALKSNDPKQIRKAMQYITRNKLVDFLSITQEIESYPDLDTDSRCYVKICNLTLMGLRGSICSAKVAEYLEEKDLRVVCKAIKVLAVIGSNRYLRELLKCLNHQNQNVSNTAKATFDLISQERMIEVMRNLAYSKNPDLKNLFLSSCDKLNFHRAKDFLKTLLRDDDIQVRNSAMALIQRFSSNSDQGVQLSKDNLYDDFEDHYDLNQLEQNLEQEQDSSKIAALLSKLSNSSIDSKQKLRIFMTLLCHERDQVRASAIEFMAPFIPEGHMDFFIPFLEDSNHVLRGKAIVALGSDKKAMAEYSNFIRSSLESLVSDERPAFKLTAIECLGILQDIDFVDLCMQLINCGNAGVESKVKELMNSWSKVDSRVRDNVMRWLSSHREFDSKESSQNPEEDVEIIVPKIPKIMNSSDISAKLNFLTNLMSREQDFVLVESLLPYLKTENNPEVLAGLIEAISSLGCEDKYLHFQCFLQSSEPILIYTAVKSLITEHSFRVIPVVDKLIVTANLDSNYYAETILLAMPYLVTEREPQALRAMQLLAKGGRAAQICFAKALKFWSLSNSILTREIHNLFVISNDPETLNQCANYLLNSMDGEVLIGKVDFLLKKVTHSESRSCLNQLKIDAEKKHAK